MSGLAGVLSLNRRLILASLVLTFCLQPYGQARAQSASQSVRLVIDYGDGVVKIFDHLPWSRGEMVIDALNAAHSSPHGISFTYTGTGPNAFLTKIDDLRNEGAGSASKNWQYWVNTTYADRSFAVYPIDAVDTVFWRFATAVGK